MQSKHETKTTHVEQVERCVEFHLSVVTIERSQVQLSAKAATLGTSIGEQVDKLIHDAMREGKQLRELTINLSELQGA